MGDLNLLPSEAKFQAERMRLKKMVNNIIWIIGGAWLILVIMVMGWNLLGQLNVNQLKKKLLKSADRYKNMAPDILVSQQVKYQAKVVATVLQKRFEYGSSMEKIKNIFSENVVIDSFDLGDNKTYKIKANVPKLGDFEEVEVKVDEINLGLVEGLDFAKIEKLEINKNGGWNFEMEVRLL